jgi:hypothetical protein
VSHFLIATHLLLLLLPAVVLVLVVQVALPVVPEAEVAEVMVLMAGVLAYPVKVIAAVHHQQVVIHQEAAVERVLLVRLLQPVVPVVMVVQVLHRLYQVRQ